MSVLDQQVSKNVKDEMSIIRLRNLLGIYPALLLKYEKTSMKNKEFAEVIGLSADYWYLIRSGKRSFTRKTAESIEERLNLNAGELDLNPDEAGTISELMLDCIAEYTTAVNKKGVKLDAKKTRKIIKRLHSASLEKGKVDLDELDSLLSLAS